MCLLIDSGVVIKIFLLYFENEIAQMVVALMDKTCVQTFQEVYHENISWRI